MMLDGDNVRRVIIDAAEAHSLCRDGTNEVLSELGLDPWFTKYDVVGEYDESTVIEVLGVEAEDEDAAIELVTNGLPWAIEFGEPSVNYSGPGEFDTYSVEIAVHDLDFTATEA
jgi:hypothetical protein